MGLALLRRRAAEPGSIRYPAELLELVELVVAAGMELIGVELHF